MSPPNRILMCPPTHFGVRYEINLWMDTARQADDDAAIVQWERLRATLTGLGATVDLEEPRPGLPDQVFTANAGFALGGRALVASFLHPERQGEEPVHERWFREAGFETWKTTHILEGAGDLCGGVDVLFAGYGIRSDRRAHAEAAAFLGVEVVSLEMTDPWLYHLDLVMAPLDARTALVAPHALTAASARAVGERFADTIELTREEAHAFTANCLVLGDRVVMHHCPPRIGRELEARGFEAIESPVGEFLKGGGGVRCMGLFLDGGPAAPEPVEVAGGAHG